MTGKHRGAAKRLEQAARERSEETYVLRLFVAGLAPRSLEAIRAVKKVCEERLAGRYQLEIVDVYQHPELLKEQQVVAVPTLVKKLPLPLRRLIGDMASTEKLLVGLNLRTTHDDAEE